MYRILEMLRIKTTPVDVIELCCSFFTYAVLFASNSMLVHDHQWVNYTKWTQQNFIITFLTFFFSTESRCGHVSESKQFQASGLTFNKNQTFNFTLQIRINSWQYTFKQFHWFNSSQIQSSHFQSLFRKCDLREMNVICLNHEE